MRRSEKLAKVSMIRNCNKREIWEVCIKKGEELIIRMLRPFIGGNSNINTVDVLVLFRVNVCLVDFIKRSAFNLLQNRVHHSCNYMGYLF